MHIEKELEAH